MASVTPHLKQSGTSASMAPSAADSESDSWIIDEKYIIDDSPSRRDGMSLEEENKCRRRTCIFIDEAGPRLKFPRLTVATAIIFFHRFFALQSFKRHSRFIVAVTCLFLAGKVEESYKKLNMVLKLCHDLWFRDRRDVAKLELESEQYNKYRLQVLQCERILLHTVAFDLCVKHPYPDLMEKVRTATNGLGLVPPAKTKDFGSSVVRFVNDSMRTHLCLLFDPAKIASAAVYMAIMYVEFTIPDEDLPKWGKLLDISHRDLKKICTIMMESYMHTIYMEKEQNMIKLKQRLVDDQTIPKDFPTYVKTHKQASSSSSSSRPRSSSASTSSGTRDPPSASAASGAWAASKRPIEGPGQSAGVKREASDRERDAHAASVSSSSRTAGSSAQTAAKRAKTE